MKVSDVMRKARVTILPDTDFMTILCTYCSDQIFRVIFVVDEKGKLLGVISDYGFLKQVTPSYLDSNLAEAISDDEHLARMITSGNKHKKGRDLMNPEFGWVHPDDTLLKANALIKERFVNALPVLDAEGRLLGIITRRDILCYLGRTCGCPLPQAG